MDTQENKFEELPEDCGFQPYNRGPCHSEETEFVKMETNTLGEGQLHPCLGILCANVFPFSEKYGWLITDDVMFWKRATEAVAVACDNGAKGWNKLHLMGIADITSELQKRGF